jgi:tetratricopeptide (TPR) repeat protein
LRFDPLQEDLQRDAIRLLYRMGDRPAAIRRYDQLRRLLDDEMGVPPMLETRQLYDAILTEKLPPLATASLKKSVPEAGWGLPTRSTAAVGPPPRRVKDLPLVGRQKELAVVQDPGNCGQLLLIEGEAGIGKTSLVQTALAQRPGVVLECAAHELEDGLPYQPIRDALAGLALRPDWAAWKGQLQLAPIWQAEVIRLAPQLELAVSVQSPNLDEARLWEGVHQFFQALARIVPVSLFLDDLQWADRSTLGLLGYLVRRGPADDRLCYLAAVRSVTPRSHLAALLQSLTRLDKVYRLPLKRLDTASVASLAELLAPDRQAAARLADWLVQVTEGIPYVLVEMVRHAHRQGFLSLDGTLDPAAIPSAPQVPPTIYSLIQSRLAQLSEPARRVVEAAGVIGREFEAEVAWRASGLSEVSAMEALDELQAAGLIRPLDGERYSFDHSLTFEVANRESGEQRRRLLHRRVAETLVQVYHLETVARGRTALPAGLERKVGVVAFHFWEGADAQRAIPYALAAGQIAARLAAWSEAALFYEKALALELDPERRREILVSLGDVRFSHGQALPAAENYREALATAKPGSPQSYRIRLALGQAQLLLGRYSDSIEQARLVLEGSGCQDRIQAESLWGAALSLEGSDLGEARRHLEAAANLCDQLDEPDRLSALAHIQFDLGSIQAQQGQLHEAVRLYHAALENAQKVPEDKALTWQILAYNNLAYHLHLLDDPAALEYGRTGLALAVEKGALTAQTYLNSTLGEISLAAGRLDEADTYFREGLALAERLAMVERVAGLTANLGRLAAARQQNDLAIHLLSTALARADDLGTRHLAVRVRIWLAPLLPKPQARQQLAEARVLAEGRLGLIAEIDRVFTELFTPA